MPLMKEFTRCTFKKPWENLKNIDVGGRMRECQRIRECI